MSWGELLLIIVSFCGPHTDGNISLEIANKCRHERVACMKNAVALFPNNNNAADLIDACLEAPDAFHAPVPKPSAVPSVVPSPTPSASPSQK